RDDRVLVAISGGKDSLALWHALLRLGYQADGMYIRLGIGEYSERSQAKSEAFAAKHGLRLHQVDLAADHGFTIPQMRNQREGKPCAACGTVKRYHFNKVAVDLGYSVVATGHNLDDEAATLFGNVLHWQTDFHDRRGLRLLPHGRAPAEEAPLHRLPARRGGAALPRLPARRGGAALPRLPARRGGWGGAAAVTFFDKLRAAAVARETLLCVGLD